MLFIQSSPGSAVHSSSTPVDLLLTEGSVQSRTWRPRPGPSAPPERSLPASLTRRLPLGTPRDLGAQLNASRRIRHRSSRGDPRDLRLYLDLLWRRQNSREPQVDPKGKGQEVEEPIQTRNPTAARKGGQGLLALYLYGVVQAFRSQTRRTSGSQASPSRTRQRQDPAVWPQNPCSRDRCAQSP